MPIAYDRMPTAAEVKAELKSNGIKGYSGKKKAELYEMIKMLPIASSRRLLGPRTPAAPAVIADSMRKYEEAKERAKAAFEKLSEKKAKPANPPVKEEEKIEKRQEAFIVELMTKFFKNPDKYYLKEWYDDAVSKRTVKSIKDVYDIPGHTLWLNKGSKELEGYNSGYAGEKIRWRIFDTQTRIIWDDDTDLPSSYEAWKTSVGRGPNQESIKKILLNILNNIKSLKYIEVSQRDYIIDRKNDTDIYIHKIRQIKHEGDYQEWQTSNLPIYYGVLKGEYKYKDSIVIYYIDFPDSKNQEIKLRINLPETISQNEALNKTIQTISNGTYSYREKDKYD